MKQINFSHEGGFPLEQETLERLQSAYRTELFGALKAHFSIETCKNYIVATATEKKNGWAIIHLDKKDCTDPEYNEETPEGILYPILKGKPTGYLKTIRKDTNLIYGTGKSQTAYFDYEAVYIEQAEYTTGASQTDKTLAANYHILGSFKEILDHAALEKILTELDTAVTANTKAIGDNTKAIADNAKLIGDNTKAIGNNTKLIGDNTDAIERIKDTYLPRDGSKAMTGNLTVEGKVNFNNVDLTDGGTLLLLNGSNQVVKNNTLIQSILNEIEALKNKSATAIPIGMIAIWGKSGPFPQGWREYEPLSGRMPVGLKTSDPAFNTFLGDGGNKEKKLLIEELPPHFHHKPNSPFKSFSALSKEFGEGTSPGIAADSNENDDEVAVAGIKAAYGPNGDALEQTIGNGQSFSILNPYRVVYFIEYVGLQGDITKPTSPTNLAATNITDTSITLKWTKSTDNIAVTSYSISINGTKSILVGDIDSYVVRELNPDTYYSFYVTAQDAAGNSSAPATLEDVITRGNSAPNQPTSPTGLRAALTGKNKVQISWNIATNQGTGVVYGIFRKGKGLGETFQKIGQTTEIFYADTSVNSDYTHTYYVAILDASGLATDYRTMEEEVKGDPNIADE
ncbi:fibronectin type III domain-containing protein [Flavobacterium sp. UGB4466]|uniref:fibronectin type III domain-containing protein n=1 Tax=Flavobacterium sp. UGB4466 TaxID=2730889 RepID=UPI00192BF057|nr:fibronectin type III domain-containing protein [Flavobacterium sp. UGB4466]